MIILIEVINNLVAKKFLILKILIEGIFPVIESISIFLFFFWKIGWKIVIELNRVII